MPLTCPVCRASNDAGPSCRRCRADLSLLFAIEAERAAALEASHQSLAALQLDRAASQAHRAGELRQGADAQRLLAAVDLMRRDFASAWNRYAAACSMAEG